LAAIFGEFALHGLEAQRVLACRAAVVRPQQCGGLCPEVVILNFQPLYLRNQPLAQSRMRGEPLVVIGDLLPQVFLFHFQKRLGILLFETTDEQAEEASYDIAESFKHDFLLNFVQKTVLSNDQPAWSLVVRVIEGCCGFDFADRCTHSSPPRPAR
jgi:hypothetical protein